MHKLFGTLNKNKLHTRTKHLKPPKRLHNSFSQRNPRCHALEIRRVLGGDNQSRQQRHVEVCRRQLDFQQRHLRVVQDSASLQRRELRGDARGVAVPHGLCVEEARRVLC